LTLCNVNSAISMGTTSELPLVGSSAGSIRSMTTSIGSRFHSGSNSITPSNRSEPGKKKSAGIGLMLKSKKDSPSTVYRSTPGLTVWAVARDCKHPIATMTRSQCLICGIKDPSSSLCMVLFRARKPFLERPCFLIFVSC
jgi:hypothetical protein